MRLPNISSRIRNRTIMLKSSFKGIVRDPVPTATKHCSWWPPTAHSCSVQGLLRHHPSQVSASFICPLISENVSPSALPSRTLGIWRKRPRLAHFYSFQTWAQSKAHGLLKECMNELSKGEPLATSSKTVIPFWPLLLRAINSLKSCPWEPVLTELCLHSRHLLIVAPH